MFKVKELKVPIRVIDEFNGKYFRKNSSDENRENKTKKGFVAFLVIFWSVSYFGV